MSFPQVCLSRPAVALPADRLDNAEVLRRIRENYRGDPEVWPLIEAGVAVVFEKCNSQYRYLESDQTIDPAEYAVRAARACLEENGVAAAELDLLLYGGIARAYFEPATAMEVAAKLGVQQIHAFDVTSACVGQLEAIHIASAYLNLYPHMNTALVCSGELTRGFLAYDIQSPEELMTKAAGLTIGNAGSAWLVRREPFAGGCVRLLAMDNFCLPQHWELCQAPIDGTFTSRSRELFALNVHVPPNLKRVIESQGWTPADVEHFVFHQPSEHMVVKVLAGLGVDPARGILTHHLFGNTSSTTVALTMNELLGQDRVRAGDKLCLASAAAGFSLVSALGEWVG